MVSPFVHKLYYIVCRGRRPRRPAGADKIPYKPQGKPFPVTVGANIVRPRVDASIDPYSKSVTFELLNKKF